MIISLTGFKGAGKSTIAKEMGLLLDIPVFDLDAIIASKYGNIERLIAREGESVFRDIERRSLEELLVQDQKDYILALGGGTILEPECLRVIRDNTVCVYLETPYDIVLERIGDYHKYSIFSSCRNRGGVRRIYEKRLPLYEAAAHCKVPYRDRSINETAVEVIRTVTCFRSQECIQG
jgi:shikimate kinase